MHTFKIEPTSVPGFISLYTGGDCFILRKAFLRVAWKVDGQWHYCERYHGVLADDQAAGLIYEATAEGDTDGVWMKMALA
jgi:hypothetical protein